MSQFVKIDPDYLAYQGKKAASCLMWLLGWLLFGPGIAQAEQLPIKTYTTGDGLAQDTVNRIVRDSRGFLWFCTREGFSRFDGYQFTNFTPEQGLPSGSVSDLLETRNGSYWVATSSGVCRFNPAGSALFVVYELRGRGPSQVASVLLEDESGAIWCGTHAGLFRAQADGQNGFELVDVGMPAEGENDFVQALIKDRQNSLWIGTRTSGLYRRWPDGRVEHYTTQNGLPDSGVVALLEDRAGRLWVGTPRGLCRLVDQPDPNRTVVARVYTSRDGLADRWIETLFQSADGTLWVGSGGLGELIEKKSGVSRESRESGESRESRKSRKSRESGLSRPSRLSRLSRLSGLSGLSAESFRTYTSANGLSSSVILTLAEDRDGNLWMGTDSGGAMKLVRSGFTSYTTADGLAAPGVDAVIQDRAGEICAISSHGKHPINRFDGRRFSFVGPDFPKHITDFGWGSNQVAFQDRAGQWWVPTGEGLCRYPPLTHVEQLATTRPRKLYTTRDGLPFDEVFRIFEDSHGDIWISTLSTQDNGLSRWERKSDRIHTFPETDGLTALRTHPATAFCEDSAGNLWIGHWGGGLTRYGEGRFTFFNEADGLPADTIRSIYLDHAHHLWLAVSGGGLVSIDDPAQARPRFNVYTTAQGLSSNDVWCVAEDLFGQIYVGTGRGLDRLDPSTGHIKHYTAADGLMHGQVTSAFRDSRGVLWFASNIRGLSRLVPAPDPPPTPPSILIGGLRIAGVNQPLSQLGETQVGWLDLGPSQNQLSIDFVGISFAAGEVLRYQYQLDGADRDWGPASDQRSVNYARLAPGHYRFLVRAINGQGLASTAPAVVAFTIEPQVWRRWWFLALGALVAGLGIYAAYRARVARLVELERVRTRIATDLHDDIGANLSLIAMVSEVARGHFRGDDQRLKEWFSTIAATSRDTVDAMSDIVWAVNPRRDQLSDLTLRMRSFAENILEAGNIELEFRAPEPGRGVKVGADLRREVFLIFKEGINNMVRHARCSRVRVDMQTDRGWLVLRMDDNGRGFDVAGTPEGNGLASMRHRAKKLGGRLEVSSNGHGTDVVLRVPLEHRGRFW